MPSPLRGNPSDFVTSVPIINKQGVTAVVGTPTVTVTETDDSGNVLSCYGTTVPTAGDAGYAAGAIFRQTSPTLATTLYVNGGSSTSASFAPVVLSTSVATALPATGGGALDPTKGTLFTLTPTASETITASSAPVGAVAYIVVTTSGTSSFTITFGTKFKSTGTLATGTSDAKVFTITFVGDGTNMNEVARTTAM